MPVVFSCLVHPSWRETCVFFQGSRERYGRVGFGYYGFSYRRIALLCRLRQIPVSATRVEGATLEKRQVFIPVVFSFAFT